MPHSINEWQRAISQSQTRSEKRRNEPESLWPAGHRIALLLIGLLGAGAFLWGVNWLPWMLG